MSKDRLDECAVPGLRFAIRQRPCSKCFRIFFLTSFCSLQQCAQSPWWVIKRAMAEESWRSLLLRPGSFKAGLAFIRCQKRATILQDSPISTMPVHRPLTDVAIVPNSSSSSRTASSSKHELACKDASTGHHGGKGRPPACHFIFWVKESLSRRLQRMKVVQFEWQVTPAHQPLQSILEVIV